jgi:translation initiation factor 1
MGLFSGTPFDRPPHCPACDRLESECTCPPEELHRIPPEKQTARLSVEKRKKGKLVTVIRGLPAEGTDHRQLLVTLKNQCGAGGTLEGEEIEIQGMQLDRVRAVLQGMGDRVKG